MTIMMGLLDCMGPSGGAGLDFRTKHWLLQLAVLVDEALAGIPEANEQLGANETYFVLSTGPNLLTHVDEFTKEELLLKTPLLERAQEQITDFYNNKSENGTLIIRGEIVAPRAQYSTLRQQSIIGWEID